MKPGNKAESKLQSDFWELQFIVHSPAYRRALKKQRARIHRRIDRQTLKGYGS
jgi:hypothetical protein